MRVRQKTRKRLCFASAILLLIIQDAYSFVAEDSIGEESRSSFSNGQKTPVKDLADYGRPAFKIFTQSDGLPYSEISSVAIDKQGYLWAGTIDGLVRYNGKKWEKANPPDKPLKYVTVLYTAGDGSLWVGTRNNGAAKFDKGKWNVFNASSGLPSDRVISILETASQENKTAVLVGTDKGIARFEDGKWAVLEAGSGLPSNKVQSLLETKSPDGNKILWVGTDKGLVRFENGKPTLYDADSGLPNNVVRSLLETKSPNGKSIIWVGTKSGVARLEDDSWSILKSNLSIQFNDVLSLFASKSPNNSNVLWIGTSNGLVRLENGKQTLYDVNSGLPDNLVMSIAETRFGIDILWVGTRNGLVRFIENRGIIYDEKSAPLNDIVNTVLVTSSKIGGDSLWVGTMNRGLLHFENGKWSIHDKASGFPSNSVFTLVETRTQKDSQQIWACTFNGLALWEDGKWSVYKVDSGLPGNVVFNLVETVSPDGSQRIWACTEKGLAYLDNGKWVSLTIPPDLAVSIRCALETVSQDGSRILWVGTDKGLGCFKNNEWKYVDSITGLLGNIIFSLSETKTEDGKHYLWAGTNINGVCRIDLTSDKFSVVYFSESSDPALPSNTVVKVVNDSKNRIYVFTIKGAVRLTPRNHAPEDGSEYNAYYFSIEDGFPNPELLNAFMESGKDRVWTATAKGFSMLDLRNILDDADPKPLYIDCIFLNGKERPLINASSFDHSENNLAFEYSLLSYFRDSDSLFKTQLVGYDQTPSEWTSKPERNYTNLPKGSYAFRVWGKDYAGNVSGPVEIAFEIRPAPWNTWWAYFFYATSVFGAGYEGYRYRTRVLRRRNALLEEKVLDRTKALVEKNQELNQKNQELIESHQRADRIFSALAEALPGTVLDGKYRLEEKLGTGGFGAVFKATHLGLSRQVAVKVFRPAPGNDSPEALERFRLEGVSACRLAHPNAVSVLDSGVSTEGVAYLVMELLEGVSLADELRKSRRLSLRRCVEILTPVCDALSEAHSSGIVHRDIKPDNIFLHESKEGETVKVLDFGIAKFMSDDGGMLRHSASAGRLVGTPLYISPERIKGEDYDGKSDVYSLGVTLYEMATGRPPFNAGHDIIVKQLYEKPDPLRSYNSKISTEVEEVVMRALSKDPKLRPTAAELAEEFNNAVEKLPKELQEEAYQKKEFTESFGIIDAEKNGDDNLTTEDMESEIDSDSTVEPFPMSKEQWRRLQEVFHAALKISPEQRASFLDEACGDDEFLREETEKLIAENDSLDEDFLESPFRNLVRLFREDE